MFSTLILVKIACTMAAVLGLSLVAERVSARAAGVLAGFPHGIAIVLYFIGVEQGADFAAEASLFAVAGLGANVVLAFAFARLSERPVGLAAIGSIAAFLAVAGVMRLIAPGPVLAALLTLAIISAVWWLLRRGNHRELSVKPAIGPGELLLRAGFAAAIVVFITGIAALLGPEKAGLLAGFPVVTFPLLVIMHVRHGSAQVSAIVRHYPFGIVSLLVFTLTVSWGFSHLGVGFGTLVGLGAALLYLAIASGVKARLAGR
ncbi:MAG: hypothetical protein GY945_02815 [Rhodobacteraceae bacterium]|nr:hypothetical protein [Paracoccaceae bacterium]